MPVSLNVLSQFIKKFKYNSIIFMMPIKEALAHINFFMNSELSERTAMGYIINFCVPFARRHIL